MRKLQAIWQILFADKWAVFTYEYSPDNPEITIPDFFRWNVSRRDEYDNYFFDLIKKRIKRIEERK